MDRVGGGWWLGWEGIVTYVLGGEGKHICNCRVGGESIVCNSGCKA